MGAKIVTNKITVEVKRNSCIIGIEREGSSKEPRNNKNKKQPKI